MYTEERAKEVRRRVREDGERVTVVCAEMGMNYENFLRWCRRNKFKVHTKATRARARKLPIGPYPLGEIVYPLRVPRKGGRAEAIARDWKLGKLAPQQLAAKHGVCYAYAVRVRKLVGLNPPAGPGRNIKNPGHIRKGNARIEARNIAIRVDLDAGMEIMEIVKKFGVSGTTVRNTRR
jgi:hypothetical protein